ncbi:MAG: SDR family NAD(P)-dependent oxidoreductase [Deltaproteobacteria bacterium]|nr:SDR family NAD(P)-dependent oxidoreductase [Deltaproteobacteria bacterium]
MRALITSAGVRLGRATGPSAAQAGFDLTLHVHRSGRAEAVAAEARALGRRVEILQADLSSAEDCARLAAEALASGPLDALVNNAALYERRALAGDHLGGVGADAAVNTRAPFLLIQAPRPALAQSTLTGGAVVNIGDIGGERPRAGLRRSTAFRRDPHAHPLLGRGARPRGCG